MEGRGLLVDAQYRIGRGHADVYLFGRLEDGRSFVTRQRFEPYFAIPKTKAAHAERIITSLPERARIEQSELRDPDGGPVSIVVAGTPKDVPELRRALEDANITCYEADIRYARRFLIDRGISGDVLIRGEPSERDDLHADLYFDDPEVSGCERTSAELRTLSFDIETSPDARQLYSIAARDSTGDERAFIVSDTKVRGAHAYPDAGSLLEAFVAYVRERDPDLITGWNVVDFDFAQLRDYAHESGVELRLGRLDWPVTMRIYNDFLRSSSVQIAGRQVLDGIETLKTSWVDLEDYTLQTASREILGEGKELDGADRRREIAELYEQHPAKLVSYNKTDARLALDILAKLDLVSLTIERSRITGLLMEEVRGSVASLDSMYLRRLRAQGVVYYSVGRGERGDRITGGFVMDSVPGLFENVLVLDFKSLYPSIISTFNIDPMSMRADGRIEAPNGARFRTEPEGIMPSLVKELSTLRDGAKRERNDIRSYALKITMNAMFGVLANPNCRFYNLDLANAITHFGQAIIKHTAEEIRSRGYEVIYGDTDSVFVNTKTHDEHEAQRIGETLEGELNEHFTAWVRERYDVESRLVLEFERHFVRFWMPSVRGRESGSKKRYAGLVQSKDGEAIKITGLEFVRRDWTEAARTFQYELLDLLFHDGDPQDFVKDYIERLRAGAMDEKLVYRKAIRKDLDEYTKTTPPHVKAARKLDRLESNIIDYYMTANGPEPRQKLESPIDYDHYVDKQIRPIAEAILSTIGLDFDQIVQGVSQKSLFDWK